MSEHPAESREMIRKDVISHFALRLAYRSDGRREWLVKWEGEFLRLRLQDYSMHCFLEDNPECQVEEADGVPGEFVGFYRHQDGNSFYKVDFTEVLELVAERRVCLKDGKAYCPNSERDKEARIVRMFRSQLDDSMKRAKEAFARNANENLERMAPFIDGLPKQYLGKEFVSEEHANAPVELSELDRLAAENFPLCMKFAHEHLRREHHMPHVGRLQYGLFLKAIGLSLEQSLEFWHNEFTTRVGEDGWKKKNYAYNIKYNYGQVGRRISWQPYNCQKIVALPADQSDPHGCPFRTKGQRTLEDEMSQFDPRQKKEVIKQVADKNYPAACIAFFEARYGPSPRLESFLLHPNLYFIETRRDRISGDGMPPGMEQVSTAATSAAIPSSAPDVKHMDLDASTSFYDSMFEDADYDAALESTAASSSQPSESQMKLDEVAPQSHE